MNFGARVILRVRRSRRARAATLAIVLATAGHGAARAQIGSDRYASIVEDASTGSVLSEANPDAPRHPASLTKLMTLYMTFEALRDRRITRDTMVPISAEAAATPPSKLGLIPGGRLTVEEAILALVTKSANDAAAALGELLGGDEARFAQMMTLRARALGMSRTVFRNASGLPDPDMWTTARDLAVLARHILTDFPNEYGYFSTPSFVYHGRVILNHDHMLQTYPGADGMKTGFTDASGHNLVTSAKREGVRLVGVVLGAASNPERDIHMASLLNDGFEHEGVAVERQMIANHFPSFISHAQAASLHSAPRGRHPAHRPKGAVVHATKGAIEPATELPLARTPVRALVHRTSFEHPAAHHTDRSGKAPATAHSKTAGKTTGATACTARSRHRSDCTANSATAGSTSRG